MKSETLDRIIEHDIRYSNLEDEIIRTPLAWYTTAPAISIYQAANRAVRIRSESISPFAAAQEIVSFFYNRNMRPMVDLDCISEEQGVGRELRRMGVNPVIGNTRWMRYTSKEINNDWNPQIEIYRVSSLHESSERKEWVGTAHCEDIGTPDAEQWRKVLLRESCRPETSLYLARLDGITAGACELFSSDRWGRIDSVVTLPEFRRRGVASALVMTAVRDSIELGNTITYLCTETGSSAESVYLRLGFESWGVNILRRHIG